MRTPEHDEGRSSKARALAVESLEGRRLPSGMGPVLIGPGAPAGKFVYTVEDFGAPRGPATPPPPRDFTAVAMPGFFAGTRMPMGGFFISGDQPRAQGLTGRVAFMKLVPFGDPGDNVIRFDSRAGGGDGPVQLRYGAAPVMSPGLRVDATFLAVGAMRARAEMEESPAALVFSRPQRATPSAAEAPSMTEAPIAPVPAALPIAAAPDAVVVQQPPRVGPAAFASTTRGTAGAVEVQDRRVVAIADRAEPPIAAFRPSASPDTTPAAVSLLPAGEGDSVAARPGQAMPATRSTSRRVAYGGEDAAPEGAELLTHFLPLDRATLEVAIDRVFGQLSGFSPELPELDGPIDWVSAASTLLAAGIAADLVVRALNRYRRDGDQADDEEAGYVLYPGLPGGWKLEDR